METASVISDRCRRRCLDVKPIVVGLLFSLTEGAGVVDNDLFGGFQ